ncbi:hypothetical protein SporoP37_02310 [Sporosarcina sp. P37]|uniref:hypothetical protein n=1 Tax=unclassified Sporosarcina TaxID=2647733 RepID=UPI0009BF87D5|nr:MULTISPECIES: hypothetical protein [unclassified Sporosarcina]ARD47085.1 hypothetical protein SporoP33_01710 [Sporosarcina sp. P33]ARK23639.1 hypothetical protein SporoP37_02310 [Sporosarcina sp. P37]PID18738.1 hypothetical protein CSV62_06440 [Sporosarcina sp. P35]
MQKKRRQVISKGNVVVFPGTLERLHRDAKQAMERDLHKEAILHFESILEIDPEDYSVLDGMAISLYETKDYQRAKKFALLAMQNQAGDYIELLELYLSISIQLQQYDEVELTIQGLLEKEIIPPHSLQKFQYLRELNKRLSDRYEEPAIEEPPLTAQAFKKMNAMEQQEFLLSLQHQKLQPYIPLLVEVTEAADSLPIVQTYALMLLQQIGYQESLAIRKYHFETETNPSRLVSPEEDQFLGEVQFLAKSQFEKDPTASELVVNLILKYSVLLFPFHWGPYTAEEVAGAYVAYTKQLLYGRQAEESPLLAFIRSVDEEMEI